MTQSRLVGLMLGTLLAAGSGLCSTIEMRADNATPKVGEEFQVTVHLQNAAPFRTWQNLLRFDGSKLRFISVRPGTFTMYVADVRGASTINATGEIHSGGFRFLDNEGGSGTLGVVTLLALSVGTTRITTQNRSPTSPFGNSVYDGRRREALPQILGDLVINIQEGTEPPPPPPEPEPEPEPEATTTTSSAEKPVVVIIIGDPTAGEGGDTAWHIIKRIGDNTNDLVVNIRLSGTATEGRDFATIGTTVTLPRTQSEIKLRFEPVDDSEVEPKEQVTVTLLPGTTYVLGPWTSATVTITDNDQPVEP